MPLIIRDFNKGLASSPYVGDGAFARSQALDIFGQKGIARIHYLPTALTGTVSDLPRQFTRSSTSGATTTFYFADDSGKVYSVDASGLSVSEQTPTANAKNVLHWKGYELIFKNNLQYRDVTNWTDLAGSPIFSSGVQEKVPFVSRNDGKVYITSGRYIDTLAENSGQDFNPANAATFTFTQRAFTLPEEYWALGLSEIGKYIIIAAISTQHGSFEESKNSFTTYFFWDRTSSTADRILEIFEKRMTNLLTFLGGVFITGGDKGNIYLLSESGTQLYFQMPFDFDNAKSVQIGGLGYSSMAWWRGGLLVGVSSLDGLYPAGIYYIKEGKMEHLCLTSEGFDGSTKDILIGGIFPYDEDTFFFGWENNTDGTRGVDRVITSGNRVTNYGSYFESLLYPVGTKDLKKSFSKIEVQLARALQSGEGVRIKYRKDISASFTTLATKDFSTEGAVKSLSFPGIHECENLQIRVELTTGSSSKNTPYITEVRVLD